MYLDFVFVLCKLSACYEPSVFFRGHYRGGYASHYLLARSESIISVVVMPAPRLSLSAEAARAAAQQAEFNEKKWVWVPDAKEGYLAGWVNRDEEEVAEVVMAAGGEVCINVPQAPCSYRSVCM